ncbi:MAG TPA: flagellar hook-associated protein FlgK [Vicinamibacterales bacterium]
MSGLFGMLSITAKALDAQRYGLDVTGQNIANVNTAGYTRRVVDLGAVPPADQRLNAGGGVEVLGVRSQRDRFLDRRLFEERPAEQREAAIAEALSIVEVSLGPPEASLTPRLAAFFEAFADLAEAPTSSDARSAVVAQGESLAAEFRATGDRLEAATQDIDGRIRATVDEINSLARRLASVNERIANSDAGGTLTLKDEQTEIIKGLSGLLDIEVIEHDNGTMQVSYGYGRALVISNNAYPLTVQNAPVTGLAQVYSDVSNTTGEIQGGKLAGLIHTRDTLIPSYRASLDELAYEVVQQVNALHDAGYTLGGVDAPVFFQPLASSAGAASLITVNPAVSADPSLVAAAGVPGTPGDNTQARALAALRDARVMNGGTTTFAAFYINVVYEAGEARNFAMAEQRTRAEVVRQIENLRDSISGVSLDEEAANMMRFQRAYEANARFFSVVNETLDVLLNLGR